MRYEGFTCKSNVTKCVDAQETLLRKHNTLVDDYNDLLKKHKELADDFDETITAARALKSDYDRLATSITDMETCLLYASTLDDAKLCTPRNVSTTLRQWHLDFKLDFLRLALVG
jgi:hypothetical protein